MACGACGVGRTAAGAGAGTDAVGVGWGAGCTTPLGDSPTLGRYSQASVPPRTRIGRPINNAINGTTRRLDSLSVGPPTNAPGSSRRGGGGSIGGWKGGG